MSSFYADPDESNDWVQPEVTENNEWTAAGCGSTGGSYRTSFFNCLGPLSYQDFVLKAGDTMSGDLDMGDNAIVNANIDSSTIQGGTF